MEDYVNQAQQVMSRIAKDASPPRSSVYFYRQ